MGAEDRERRVFKRIILDYDASCHDDPGNSPEHALARAVAKEMVREYIQTQKRLDEQDKRIEAFVHSDAADPDGVRCVSVDGVHKLAEAMEIGQRVVWACCDCGRRFEPKEMRRCSLAQLKEMGVLR